MNTKLIYLHGYASGPKSKKGLFFQEKIRSHFKEELFLADLNQPSFEYLSMQAQLDYISEYIATTDSLLIASSLGAYIASLLAESFPERVKALILLAPAYDFVKRREVELGEAFLKNWEKEGFVGVEHHYYGEKRKLHYQIMTESKKFEKSAYKFQQNTLVFHGLKDELVPHQISQKYLGEKSNCQLFYVEDNHSLIDSLPFIWEKSKHFLATYLEGKK